MSESTHPVQLIELKQSDIDYFKRGEHENPRFWVRLGGEPDFKNAEVVDIGCGHGSLCIDIALSGAKRVVGLDIDSHRIEFANENLRRNYPHLRSVVDFRNIELAEYPEFELDAIVSKDTFEHISNLEVTLGEMKRRLKPGGKIYAAIGPLYNAPDGDHGRTGILLPWGHLLVSETKIIERLNQHRDTPIGSIEDLGLNKMSFQDYRRAFHKSGLSIEFFRVNQGARLPLHYRLILESFSLVRRIPFLEEYFTSNVYCILKKDDRESFPPDL